MHARLLAPQLLAVCRHPAFGPTPVLNELCAAVDPKQTNPNPSPSPNPNLDPNLTPNPNPNPNPNPDLSRACSYLCLATLCSLLALTYYWYSLTTACDAPPMLSNPNPTPNPGPYPYP